MYGTRGAAQNLYKEYSNHLIQIGFHQGQASPCTFYNEENGIRTYVHGDDYVSTGMPESRQWLRKELEKKSTVKAQTLGPGNEDQKQIKIPNRIVTWNNTNGINYEADHRHVEIIIKQLQLADANIITTPSTKEEGTTIEDKDVALGDKEVTNYRALVARCNYLSPDRPNIAYIVKELARAMATPTKGDLQRLKRLARYLKGRPRLVMQYKWQPMQSTMTTYREADWAGCRETRKSTTGGCIKIGGHCIKGWSKTQALIARSSGESEFYAALKAAAETLGMLSMMADFGWRMHGEVWGDANAALGIINRNGLGWRRAFCGYNKWRQSKG